jgi:hypothetical protein
VRADVDNRVGLLLEARVVGRLDPLSIAVLRYVELL